MPLPPRMMLACRSSFWSRRSSPRSTLSITAVATASFCTLYPCVTWSASSSMTGRRTPVESTAATYECHTPPARAFCFSSVRRTLPSPVLRRPTSSAVAGVASPNAAAAAAAPTPRADLRVIERAMLFPRPSSGMAPGTVGRWRHGGQRKKDHCRWMQRFGLLSRERLCRADEVGDHLAEALAGVLLQEVAGAADGWVVQPGRTGYRVLEHGRHRTGDGIAVAERHEERLVPGGQLVPGGTVRRCRRIVRPGGDKAGHRAYRGFEALVRKRRVIGGEDLGGECRLATGLDEPRHVEPWRAQHGVAEPQPDLGHRLVARGQAGVGGHHPGEALRVVGDLGGLVGAAEPDQVRRDCAAAGIGEHGHYRAVEERPARLAVQQQHRRAVGGTRLDVGHPEGYLRVARLVPEAG